MQETRLLFQAYVGGVYKEGGLELVLHWLNGLTNDNTLLRSSAAINQAAQPSTRTTEFSGPPQYINAPKGSPPPPPQKKVKSDPPIFTAAQPPRSSAPAQMSQFILPTAYPSGYGQPQYPAMASKFANPIAPAQPNLAFLPLFNQTATQRRVTVEYPAEFSGPSHAGKWTVKCVGEPFLY